MRTKQSRDDQQARKDINAPRPSPLKIYKDSHLIQKLPSTLSFNGSATFASTKHHQQQHNKQPRHPVVIYTNSPKIIHTQARDFMALVQKLTGRSHSDDCRPQPQSLRQNGKSSSSEGDDKNNNNNGTRPAASAHEDNESSSVTADENCGGCSGSGVCSSSVSPFEPPSNPFFSDIPLFTPNSANAFCSAQPFYRYS